MICHIAGDGRPAFLGATAATALYWINAGLAGRFSVAGKAAPAFFLRD
jgi:hypothetical protein